MGSLYKISRLNIANIEIFLHLITSTINRLIIKLINLLIEQSTNQLLFQFINKTEFS